MFLSKLLALDLMDARRKACGWEIKEVAVLGTLVIATIFFLCVALKHQS